MKVVYNACYGGFNLSAEAIKRYAELKGYAAAQIDDTDIPRDDPDLVRVVEELGDKANGFAANLKIEDIPKGSLYRIDVYDGNEAVMTQDSYEWKVST